MNQFPGDDRTDSILIVWPSSTTRIIEKKTGHLHWLFTVSGLQFLDYGKYDKPHWQKQLLYFLSYFSYFTVIITTRHKINRSHNTEWNPNYWTKPDHCKTVGNLFPSIRCFFIYFFFILKKTYIFGLVSVHLYIIIQYKCPSLFTLLFGCYDGHWKT